MNLVVGATGMVGFEICRLLRQADKPVRGLCRPTAAPERRKALAAMGVEIVAADLKDPVSLERASVGARTVLSTASSTLSRQAGDSIESVDLRGHLHLVQAARKADVEHMVFVSFAKGPVDFPLQTAKRAVENELISSGLGYTILQPTYFMEVWLGPALGFDAVKGAVRILGTGEARTTWISYLDVARFAAAAVDNPRAAGRVLPLGGPEALSAHQVLGIFRELGAPEATVESVSEKELEQQWISAVDPLQRSFAGLMLTVARGQAVDSRAALELLPGPLTTVRSYAAGLLSSSSHS
jgi:NADH dehydrogenase